MQIDELTLVLLGAFWTGTTAVFTGMQMSDTVRDRIALGKIDEVAVSTEYRRHLLWCSWIPLRVSLASVSALLGVIIVLLPKLATGSNESTGSMFATICLLSASVPFAGALLFSITTVFELRKLRGWIRGDTGPNGDRG